MTKKEIQELMDLMRECRNLASELSHDMLDLWLRLYCMKHKDIKPDMKYPGEQIKPRENLG